MKIKKYSLVVVLLLVLSLAIPVNAQEILPPLTPYTQNFDTLASTPNDEFASIVPNGWVFVESGTAANTTYRIGTGSANTGDTYSFGAIDSTDRAFGALLSGSLVSTIGVHFENGTGGTIGQLSIQYYCEMWRQGATGRVDRMDFQYSVDATSLTDGTWVDFDDLDCVGQDTGVVGAKDGNVLRTLVSGNITGLNIAHGETFWLRWLDFNAAGADDGLAIDDFVMNEFTATAVTFTSLNALSPALGISAALVLAGAVVTLRKRK